MDAPISWLRKVAIHIPHAIKMLHDREPTVHKISLALAKNYFPSGNRSNKISQTLVRVFHSVGTCEWSYKFPFYIQLYDHGMDLSTKNIIVFQGFNFSLPFSPSLTLPLEIQWAFIVFDCFHRSSFRLRKSRPAAC